MYYKSIQDAVAGTQADYKIIVSSKPSASKAIKDKESVKMTEWQKQEGGQNIWIPTEEGEELIGKVVNKQEGSYGPQWVIEDKEGNEHRTPSHKVLQNRMTSVEPDNEVKIVYLGEEPPSVKGQNPTRLYDVFVAKK